jgi:hypothetical protein
MSQYGLWCSGLWGFVFVVHSRFNLKPLIKSTLIESKGKGFG